MGRPKKTETKAKSKVVVKKAKKKNIFLLSSVNELSKAELRDIMAHEDTLGNHNTVIPSIITKTDTDPVKFFLTLKKMIEKADEVHVFYNPKSRSTNMLLGLALGLKKKLMYPVTTAKSYSEDWKTALVPNVVVHSTSEKLDADTNRLVMADDVLSNPNTEL